MNRRSDAFRGACSVKPAVANRLWALVRHDLASLLLFMGAVALILGCVVYFRNFWLGLFAGWFSSSALLLLARKRKAWLIICFLVVIYLTVFFFFVIGDIYIGSPYVKSYNRHLEKLAVEANLVGAKEDLVSETLGMPTIIYKGWSETSAATGEPTPSAYLITTYRYAPYPMFPQIRAFEVHCVDGKVRSIKLFDD